MRALDRERVAAAAERDIDGLEAGVIDATRHAQAGEGGARELALVGGPVPGIEQRQGVRAGIAAHFNQAGDLVDRVGGVIDVDVIGVVAGVDLKQAGRRLDVHRVEAGAGGEDRLAGVRARNRELVVAGAERDVDQLEPVVVELGAIDRQRGVRGDTWSD